MSEAVKKGNRSANVGAEFPDGIVTLGHLISYRLSLAADREQRCTHKLVGDAEIGIQLGPESSEWVLRMAKFSLDAHATIRCMFFSPEIDFRAGHGTRFASTNT